MKENSWFDFCSMGKTKKLSFYHWYPKRLKKNVHNYFAKSILVWGWQSGSRDCHNFNRIWYRNLLHCDSMYVRPFWCMLLETIIKTFENENFTFSQPYDRYGWYHYGLDCSFHLVLGWIVGTYTSPSPYCDSLRVTLFFDSAFRAWGFKNVYKFRLPLVSI